MKELSLNILDIAENSVKAGATLTEITLSETDDTLTITIKDDGCGMSKEVLESVTNPFYTTRTTRPVGLGIPLFKLAAEQTGGNIEIHSKVKSESCDLHGTSVKALFYKNHIDFTPLGDIVSTMTTLIQGSPQIDFEFLHVSDRFRVSLDTRQLREILGEEIPLSSPEILLWISQYLGEQYENLSN